MYQRIDPDPEKKIDVGNLVKTTLYYNTAPFGETPIQKGRVLEINMISGQEYASVREGHGHVIEIPVRYLIKIR